MADLVALFARSIERFVDRVDQVGPDQWSSSTPCADWDEITALKEAGGVL